MSVISSHQIHLQGERNEAIVLETVVFAGASSNLMSAS